VLFRDELLADEESDTGLSLTLTLTREPPKRTSDFGRRIDAAMVEGVARRLPAAPGYVFICGSNAFVDVAADGALGAGLEAASIRTERYGA
jgi:ferredoxin-NADP reductase